MKYLKLYEDYENYSEYLSLKDVLLKLGYKNPKQIANGGSSTIWKTSENNDIIKLSNSSISANTMEYIKNNIDSTSFIKTKKVYRVVGDVIINDMYYNYNPYELNRYPLYVLEMEYLEQLSKKDLKTIDYNELLDVCYENGIQHQDLHKDNIMKRKNGEIVLVDVLDDSLPKQDIETINI